MTAVIVNAIRRASPVFSCHSPSLYLYIHSHSHYLYIHIHSLYLYIHIHSLYLYIHSHSLYLYSVHLCSLMSIVHAPQC